MLNIVFYTHTHTHTHTASSCSQRVGFFKCAFKQLIDIIKLEENTDKTIWYKLYQCFLGSVSQDNRNKSKNEQIEPNKTYQLLYSKGNHKQNEKIYYILR